MEALHQRITRLEAIGDFDDQVDIEKEMEEIPRSRLREYVGQALYIDHRTRFRGILKVVLVKYNDQTGRCTVNIGDNDLYVLGPDAKLYQWKHRQMGS